MGCCSSTLSAAATADSNSAKYSETGAQSLHFATPQIQVREMATYTSLLTKESTMQQRGHVAQVHACAAGFFRHATIQQLMCMDVREDHILAAIGHAEDPAALSVQLRALPQVPILPMHDPVVSDQPCPWLGVPASS